MAYEYNFMGLVNDLCLRLNEEPLTSTNFDTVDGFYNAAKTYINAAIRDINQQEYNWPFNHNVAELELDAGTSRYAYPAEAKLVDLDSLQLHPPYGESGSSFALTQIQYNEYLRKYPGEDRKSADQGGTPKFVAMSQAQEICIAPTPNKDYELTFEYFIFPSELVAYTDVPTIPERFRHVIIDGAMYHAYMFRDNSQSAGLSQQKFEQGIKAMRSMLTNDYLNVVDTRVVR